MSYLYFIFFLYKWSVHNRIKSLQKDVEGAMEKAELATEKVERVEKKVEKESTISGSTYFGSSVSMSSPYLYMPHSNPYAGYYP